jgi:hypothetical protein
VNGDRSEAFKSIEKEVVDEIKAGNFNWTVYFAVL